GGSNRNEWYTDGFSGTSSASPIIVGVLGCLQGILRAKGKIPLSPRRVKELFRSTGSPQQDGPGFTDPAGKVHSDRTRNQRIGNRPDLRQLIGQALETQPDLRQLIGQALETQPDLRQFIARAFDTPT